MLKSFPQILRIPFLLKLSNSLLSIIRYQIVYFEDIALLLLRDY